MRSTSRARSALICSLIVRPVSAAQSLQDSGPATAAELTDAQTARLNNIIDFFAMVMCTAVGRGCASLMMSSRLRRDLIVPPGLSSMRNASKRLLQVDVNARVQDFRVFFLAEVSGNSAFTNVR
jgi:hypothetical protein